MLVQTQSNSPADLEFGPRRPSFDIDVALSSGWHSGSAFVTAWLNRMSMLFRLSEKFFIDSVVHYLDDIDDPHLAAEISAFRTQEASHRMQHQKYNVALCERRGYSPDRIKKNARARIAWANRELSARGRSGRCKPRNHRTLALARHRINRALGGRI
jgi:predicted metal-dependent hydrolase